MVMCGVYADMTMRILGGAISLSGKESLQRISRWRNIHSGVAGHDATLRMYC